MRIAAIAVAGLFMASEVPAQADTAAIPRELATALVSTTDYSSSRARIVVGTFPTPEMSRLAPRGGRVLGGLVYEDRRGNATRFTGLLEFPESPDSVATLLEAQVTRAGFKPPEMQGMYGYGGGFLPAAYGGVGRERPLMFCGDSMSVTALVNEYPTGSLLRLTTQPSVRGSICETRPRVVGAVSDRPSMIILPTLRPPKGATGGPGSSGGGSYRRSSSAQYMSTESVEDMISHFASQLTQQGWTLGKRVVSDDAALLTARKVEKGETNFLLLTDALSGPRQHEVEVSVAIPSRRP